MNHAKIEKNVGLLGVLTAIVISIGGLVEIVPLYFTGQVGQASPGVKPYTALQLEGRDIYLREGCYNCHSQMIRSLRAETNRYGHASMAGESVYDHRSSSVLSAQAPISPASAVAIQTNGIVPISTTPVMLFRNRTCLATRGWRQHRSTQTTPPQR